MAVPPPAKTHRGFTSDNIAGVSPEILDALMACNMGQASPYGADAFSQCIEQQLQAIFECDLRVFLVSTGSAANVLGLSVMTPPWGNIYCHPESHINVDECGAAEFYTHGAKLIPVAGDNAKIDPKRLAPLLQRKVGDVHSTQPAAVSISQATETGHVYRVDEIQTIGQLCRQANVRLHMDGARFANALVSLGCSPAEMTWQAGVDVLSFGATKNGVMGAEAIVLFDTTLADELAYRRKRGGHLCSKMRYLSAQMQAYLDNGLWLSNAQHANAMAARLADGIQDIEQVELLGEVHANMLFCKLPSSLIESLLRQGFAFYHDRWDEGVVRLVTSFSTTEAEVEALLSAMKQPSSV